MFQFPKRAEFNHALPKGKSPDPPEDAVARIGAEPLSVLDWHSGHNTLEFNE